MDNQNTKNTEQTVYIQKTVYDSNYWKKHLSWTFNNL